MALFAEVQLDSVTRDGDNVDIGMTYRIVNSVNATLLSKAFTKTIPLDEVPSTAIALADDELPKAIQWAMAELAVSALTSSIGGKKKVQIQA